MAFTVLGDRGLSGQVQLSEWCRTMDLLALCNDNDVWVHRLSWQRLFLATTHSANTALTWSPNGKMIACGGLDGSLSFINVESGDIVCHMKHATSSVVSLKWTESKAKESGQKFEDRSAHFLPRLPVLAPVSSGAFESPVEGHDAPGMESLGEGALNVLVVGTSKGQATLLLSGTFDVGNVDLRRALVCHGRTWDFKDAHVLRAEVSPDCRLLSVVARATVGGAAGVYFVGYDVSKLGEAQSQVRDLAARATSIDASVRYIGQCLERLRKQWEGALGAFHTRLAELGKLMDAHGETKNVAEQLVQLVAMGTASPALSQFVSTTLGAQEISRLSRTVSSACAAVQQTVVDSMNPAVHALLFKLSELRGHTRSHTSYSSLLNTTKDAGLSLRNRVEGCVKFTEALAFKAEEMMRVVYSTAETYEAFFTCLSLVANTLSGEGNSEATWPDAMSSKRVTSFVRRSLGKDHIKEYLGEAPLTFPHRDIHGSKRGVLPRGSSVVEFENASLGGVVKEVREAVASLFDPVPKTLSTTFQPVHVCPLGNFEDASLSVTTRYAHEDNGGTQWLTVLDRSAANLFVAKFSSGSPEQVLAAHVRGDSGDVADCALYKDDSMLVVSRGDTGATVGMVDLEEVEFKPINNKSMLTDLAAEGFECARVREHGVAKDSTVRLVCSGTRGVGCLLVAAPGENNRAVVLDLEEDEEDAEESDEEEEDE